MQLRKKNFQEVGQQILIGAGKTLELCYDVQRREQKKRLELVIHREKVLEEKFKKVPDIEKIERFSKR